MLRAYRLPQPAAIVKLNQNESPLDWPPDLKEDVLARVASQAWNRYPPVDGEALRHALARHGGVDAEMIAVTNGSNEAILSLVSAYAGGREVVLIAPGYSMSAALAVVGGATVRPVLLRPDFSLDVDAMVAAVSRPEVGMAFVASPNNPTGNAFGRTAIETVLDASHGLMVIDEAYANFAAESFLPDLRRYPQLAVLRTFSKAFALAGARVGWIVAHPEIVVTVRKALPPYNLNVFAQQAAMAALERPELVRARVELIARERTRVTEAMRIIDGVTPYPSQANFILFRTAVHADELFTRLLRRGVLVRDVSGQPLLERCLRVTVGAPDDNDRFLAALRESVGVAS